jgi:hypothetical protein
MVFIKSFGAILCYAFTRAHLQLSHFAYEVFSSETLRHITPKSSCVFIFVNLCPWADVATKPTPELIISAHEAQQYPELRQLSTNRRVHSFTASECPRWDFSLAELSRLEFARWKFLYFGVNLVQFSYFEIISVGFHEMEIFDFHNHFRRIFHPSKSSRRDFTRFDCHLRNYLRWILCTSESSRRDFTRLIHTFRLISS